MKTAHETAMKITYRGCTLEQTNTTTDVVRYAFGRSYQTIGYIWRITGRLTTVGRGQQWLTSAAACREWIREQDARNAYRSDPDGIQS